MTSKSHWAYGSCGGGGSQQESNNVHGRAPKSVCEYMVVDLKVLDRIVDDDDLEHIKISFGESFFSSWRK